MATVAPTRAALGASTTSLRSSTSVHGQCVFRTSPRGARFSRKSAVSCQATATVEKLITKEGWYAANTVQGTSRAQNEDRFAIMQPKDVPEGQVAAAFAVFDGHGGFATAEWLAEGRFLEQCAANFRPKAPTGSLTQVCQGLDKELIAPKPGFFGQFEERGEGGSKCGSTAASAMLYKSEGKWMMASCNVGDARVLLVTEDGVKQMSEDHVPDNDDERKRIEKTNPTPKMPMVRYVGDCWRVGGILALSRAFGDSYMKASGLYEGTGFGSDNYGSGFGVIAEPYVETIEIGDDVTHVLVATDGLFPNETRGGGSGLDNDAVGSLIKQFKGQSPEVITEKLLAAAVEAGSTDDITCVLLQL